MYFEATIRPEGSQRDDVLAAAGKVLATPDPQAKIQSLIEQALSQSDGLKLDYEKDVTPWLGDKAGVWLAATSANEQPRGAAVLASTDKDAAQAALDRAVKGSGQTFTQRSYQGCRLRGRQDGAAAAVTDDFVVLGDEAELKRVLETLDGGEPLSGDDRYKAAVGGSTPTGSGRSTSTSRPRSTPRRTAIRRRRSSCSSSSACSPSIRSGRSPRR